MLPFDHMADVKLRMAAAERAARETRLARDAMAADRAAQPLPAAGGIPAVRAVRLRIHDFVARRGWLAGPATEPNPTEAWTGG